MKSTMLTSLNKKADYSLLEQVKDSLHKKVDHEYIQTVTSKLKNECTAQLNQFQTELLYSKKVKDEKIEEKLTKTETNGERALDEIFFLRDQLKQVQDERRKDVEETADFIKQIINTGKVEQQKEL